MIVKRVFDLFSSAIALAVLVPFFGVIAIWTKMGSAGPVFFRQERVGQFGKHFRIVKFRTMVSDAPSKGTSVTAGGDSRVTGTGQWLRKLKLDELPQLWNVLIGDMSIVGPRPEVPKFVGIFRSDFDDILKVKPGITDYASIQYRNEEAVLAQYPDYEEAYIKEILPAKIKLYKRYIRERSFLVDMEIIINTIRAIV